MSAARKIGPLVSETVTAARAQLDLQAELEAGARSVSRLHATLLELDRGRALHQRRRAEMLELKRRVREVRASLREQRSLMMQLRGSFGFLRRQMGRWR